MKPFRHFLAVLAASAFFTPIALAADVAGTWSLTVSTQAGTGTPTLVLVQDGDNLTGTYTGRFGEAPINGSSKGTAIEFSFTVAGPMGDAVVTYTGTVEGDTMGGSMKMGDLAGGTFTGKKQ
jgi:hypothetical protein